MRMSTSDTFIPGVVVLDDITFKAKRIELDVEPHDKVFRQKEESKGDVLEIGTVELEKVNKDNISERIVKYAKENGYSEDVISNVSQRLQKAKESIG